MLILNYLKIARVDYWPKNVFVLPGIIFYLILVKPENILSVRNFLLIILSLLGICIICSANYILNEIADLSTDKFHPLKKKRPLVSRKISVFNAKVAYFFLLICGLWIGSLINNKFFFGLLSLILMGIIYNLKPIRAKDIAYIDVLTESFNNVIRFFLGWSILNIDYYPPISLLIIFWFGGSFLMSVKRLAEYRFLKKKYLIKYRSSFKNYDEKSLLLSSIFYCIISCLFMGIFLIKYKIETLLSFPFIALSFIYYLNIGLQKNSLAQSPELIFRNKKLMLLFLVTVIVFLISIKIYVPILYVFQNISLMKY
jgi:4-hydroxybenzoate polyprenyltransferase